MNCRDFQELIDSYLSDELLTETNHDVLRHLENCANCRNVIEARREIRQRLRSAVMNAPQYQIGKNFTHNLRTQLRYEALKTHDVKASSRFGFASWIGITTAVAVLVLTFTFGVFFLSNSDENNPKPAVAVKDYYTNQLPADHIVNVAFGDHEHCAVKKGSEEPVGHAETPFKYADTEEIALPELKTILRDAKLKSSHTCEYKNTKFTHLVVEKDNKLMSVMLTEKTGADDFGKGIAYYNSKKYRLARFDVKDTAVFVVSGFDEKTNSKAAQALYDPFRKYLDEYKTFQTALLMHY